MATYFPTSSSQRDSVPMLYLREPVSTTYAATPVLPGNAVMYMNYPSSSGSYTDTLAGNSNQPNSCIDIPTVGVADSTASQQEFLSNIGESRIGENDFGSWRDGGNEMVLMHPMSGQNLQGQGLSLSLSPQITSGIQLHSIQYRNHNPGFSSFLSPNSSVSGDGREDENSQSKQSRNTDCALPGFPGSNSNSMKTDGSPYGMSNISKTISSSKYLKAAQQLLEEVVNVRKALKQHDSRKELMKDSRELDGESKNGSSSNPQDSVTTSANELSAAEKQDLQNKMTKLLSMLDEVDRRYKQYNHQMQIVVSSFDVIAGCGAAKPYTALALQTISRHFRCLRDAINGQIKVTQRNLGEPDASANSKGVGISRLRYVDQQLRQQRALQQLGMMNQHTWRPQRGLPESSVSILRAWLFEHFLHPYPKDSDKIMLARQTGLTRSQVSNWFINARVRLWKPMVEEMYKEEAGDVEMEYNSSSEIAPRSAKDDIKASGDRGAYPRQSAASTATEQCSTGQFFDSKSNHTRDVEMAGASTDPNFHNAGQGDQRASMDDCNLFADTMAAYQMSELGRFGNGSGVSLTLGLQHCEVGGNMPMSLGTHQSFVTMRADDVYNLGPSSVGPETTELDCMDSGSRQQRFGSSHLLHDFVA